MNILLIIFAAVGLSHILADGAILDPVKAWLSEKGRWGVKVVEMMNCYQCSGFWSGVVVYLLALASPYLDVLLWAFAVSLASPLVGYLKLWAASKLEP